jgi:hypothetical protein
MLQSIMPSKRDLNAVIRNYTQRRFRIVTQLILIDVAHDRSLLYSKLFIKKNNSIIYNAMDNKNKDKILINLS